MSKFIVSPHFRLQEWVAQEKGYFAAEGLDYEFREAFLRARPAAISLATKSAPIRHSRPGAPAMSVARATGR